MESFHWEQYFETGISDVDEQHHKLVDIINKFGDLLAQDTMLYSDIEIIFKELADYAVYHFEEEEAGMINAGLDKRHLEQHKQEHEHFLEEVTTLYSHISPDNLEASRHLLEYLMNWLAFHILGLDQIMAQQMRDIESGKTPSEAFEANISNRDKTTEALLSALNVLFKQVSERNKELVSLNLSLEEKVNERTKELSRANEHLELLSLTDVLTSLPNRRHGMILLENFFKESKQNNTSLTCMMIDADHFKEVNDTYGHDAGDEVLQVLTRTLVDTFRNDDTVCRLGGDEFLVICPKTDLDGAVKIAQKVREKVSKLNLNIWNSSISVGVASISDKMNNFEELIKTADEALYISKKDGKNCVRTNQ